MSSVPVERPVGVTTVVALTWISAVIDVVGGISLFVLASDEALLRAVDVTALTARTGAITAIALGAIAAVLASRLAAGSGVARMIVSLVMGLRVGGGFWALLLFGAHHLGESVLAIATGVLVLYLLWNEGANRFFAT